ncbi:NAD-dependent epimerase/dehydratase family protein [Bacillus haynesii]|nr:NAD-dependent epimerase/dehydratase family protein [Bacillus haynesii]
MSAGSFSVYGSPDLPVTEETEPEPVHPHGKVKWMMEKMLMEAEKAYGLKYVILRSFNACGPPIRHHRRQGERNTSHFKSSANRSRTPSFCSHRST